MTTSQKAHGRVGRPAGTAAASHAAIMDAVYGLLQEMPASDITVEAVARRAKVGKPTLYKWWPSKSALILEMFYERLDVGREFEPTETAEEALRAKMHHIIKQFNGLFGKVVADLIAEGQRDPSVLQDFHERHVNQRRLAAAADIERGKSTGEFAAETNTDLLIDMIFGPVYYRMLLKFSPLTQEYGDELVSVCLRGVRPG